MKETKTKQEIVCIISGSTRNSEEKLSRIIRRHEGVAGEAISIGRTGEPSLEGRDLHKVREQTKESTARRDSKVPGVEMG